MTALGVRDAMPDDGARNGEQTIELLGLVRPTDRTIWILVSYGYETEDYEFIELSSGRLRRMLVPGWRC